MAKYYIVWNEGRSEGFITDDLSDAKQTLSGRFRNPSTTVGEAFYSAYDHQELGLQTVEIDPIPETVS